ncbi:MAG: hydrolase, partial [Tissierellia bacterium]|nr:hydrolase [Tissierellia bacterium]
MPQEIYNASGIKIFGKRIKSLIYTTDLAIIKNNNADGVIAVYPFTPQLAINQAIIDISPTPVFVGVGGGTTTGQRSIDIALN